MPWRTPRVRLVAGLAAAVVVIACGKKGPPLAPLRPIPGRVIDLTARRVDDRVELLFTVPLANADNTTPSAVERVELYRLVETADAPRPPADRMLAEGTLLATVEVDSAAGEVVPDVDAADTGAAERPTRPGDAVTFSDTVPPDATVDPTTAPAWWYVAVAVANRNRRGTPSGIVKVPLGEQVSPPTDLAVAYDASVISLTWEPGPPRQPEEPDAPDAPEYRYVVSEVPDGAGETTVLTPSALEVLEFSLPVEFGRTRCFVVRATSATGATTIESVASARACVTPTDTFPPPDPTRLVAVQEGAEVVLRWRPSTAADLDGYIVLRGDGSGETLRPLVTAPVAGTSYRDSGVQTGSTYTYVVVAVDRSMPPNMSGQSNRETVVVR